MQIESRSPLAGKVEEPLVQSRLFGRIYARCERNRPVVPLPQETVALEHAPKLPGRPFPTIEEAHVAQHVCNLLARKGIVRAPKHHAVNIAENAASLSAHGTTYSVAAHRELAILESAISEILTKSEVAFTHRDVDAAYAIEPLVQVVGEIVTQLKRNHLQRMSSGVCNIYADASFTNLMVEFKRIAAVCSNVGVATVVRSNPELADHEHLYYESLRSGGSETYNTAFELAHDRFFSQLALVNAT